jgi:hypothetical protein
MLLIGLETPVPMPRDRTKTPRRSAMVLTELGQVEPAREFVAKARLQRQVALGPWHPNLLDELIGEAKRAFDAP